MKQAELSQYNSLSDVLAHKIWIDIKQVLPYVRKIMVKQTVASFVVSSLHNINRLTDILYSSIAH